MGYGGEAREGIQARKELDRKQKEYDKKVKRGEASAGGPGDPWADRNDHMNGD